MGQAAVLGKVEAAKTNGRESVAVAASSSKRRIFFFIWASLPDSDFWRLTRCGDVSDTEMTVRVVEKRQGIECSDW